MIFLLLKNYVSIQKNSSKDLYNVTKYFQINVDWTFYSTNPENMYNC